jgi:hypothetical protein
MSRRLTKQLRVSSPDGKPVYAIVTPQMETVHIEVRYLDVVAKDDPPFSRNGVIRFTCRRLANRDQPGYKAVMNQLTQYIESLYLKEMDEENKVDENIYSSIGAKSKPRRIKKSPSKPKVERTIGTGDTSGIHSSARGEEQADAFGSRESDSDVAEGSDSADSGQA